MVQNSAFEIAVGKLQMDFHGELTEIEETALKSLSSVEKQPAQEIIDESLLSNITEKEMNVRKGSQNWYTDSRFLISV